jgi:hypothetical protein
VGGFAASLSNPPSKREGHAVVLVRANHINADNFSSPNLASSAGPPCLEQSPSLFAPKCRGPLDGDVGTELGSAIAELDAATAAADRLNATIAAAASGR